MTDDPRHNFRCGFDAREVRHLFASGLVLMAFQTNPLEVAVFVTSALRKREYVIDLDSLGPVANFAHWISSEDLGSKLHPAMPSVGSR